MKSNIQVLRRLLQLVYEVLFTILLFDFMLIIFVKEQPAWYAFILVISIYLISFIARMWAPSYGLALLLHVLPMVLIWFFPITRGTFIVLAFIDFYILSDAFVFMKRNGIIMPVSDFPWPTFAISLIIYIFGYYTKSNLMTKSAYYIPVVLMILYLILLYLEGLHKYVEATKDVSSLPLKKIVFTNTMIVSMILLLIIIGIACGKWLHIDDAIIWVGKIILEFIRFIASIIAFFWRVVSAFMTTGKGQAVSFEMLGETVSNEGESNLINSLETIGKLIFLGFLMLGAYKLFSKIIKVLFMKRKLHTDTIEKIETVKKKKQESFILTREEKKKLSISDKIRRLYKNKIEHYRFEITLNQKKTAREIEKEITGKEIGDVKELTDIYAEVRYSNKNVDGKLLKHVKKMI